MYLPYDEELQIIIQNDNFLDKEFIEVKDLPKENLPLIKIGLGIRFLGRVL